MSWYWKGAWNTNRTAGGGKGSGKKKKKGKDGRQEGGKAETIFPSYDAMPLPGSASSSSSTQSSTQDNKLKQLVKALVENNAVKLPEEARHLLEEDEGEQFRTEMRRRQNVLNKKRKAHAKVQRLREAIQQKQDQFAAFQDKLKEQLQEQQEKFEEDIQSLQKSLKEAEEALQNAMEDGQEEEPEQPTAEMKVDLELANLLEAKDYGKKLEVLEDQLKNSKSENQITKQMFNAQAAQMQSYMQKLEHMQAALMHFQSEGKLPMSPSAAMTFGGKGVEVPSPQMTKPPSLGKRDPLAPFARQGDQKKQKTGQEPVPGGGTNSTPIPVVEVDASQSPQEIQKMD